MASGLDGEGPKPCLTLVEPTGLESVTPCLQSPPTDLAERPARAQQCDVARRSPPGTAHAAAVCCCTHESPVALGIEGHRVGAGRTGGGGGTRDDQAWKTRYACRTSRRFTTTMHGGAPLKSLYRGIDWYGPFSEDRTRVARTCPNHLAHPVVCQDHSSDKRRFEGLDCRTRPFLGCSMP